MKKIISVVLITLALICLLVPFAMAEEAAKEAAPAAASSSDSSTKSMAALAAALAIGIAAFGTGIGQGLGLSKACEGAARNPGAAGKIQPPSHHRSGHDRVPGYLCPARSAWYSD